MDTSSSIITNDTTTTPPTTMSSNTVEISYTLSIIQIVISGCTFIGLSILITAVLSCKKTRQQPFNIYLISLELVDLIMNGVLVATYVWALFNDRHQQQQQQKSSSYSNNDVITVVWISTDTIVIIATFVNVYLSGIVAYQIHRLLMNSYRAIRVKPPTKLRITMENLIVYFFGFALAAMYFWLSVVKSKRRMSSSSSSNLAEGGRGSMEEDNNGSSAKVFWCLCCGVLLLPLSYILYVTIQIYQKKLLSMSCNRTRSIAIYFGRIVFVFIVFYVPGTIFFAFGVASVLVDDGGITQEGWTKLIIGTIILALQGAFSFVIALTKDDIRDAVVVFLRCNKCCCCRQRQRDNNNGIVDYDDGTDLECGNAANHTLATKNETQENEETQGEEIQNDEESESLPDDDDPTLREDPAVPSGHERNLDRHSEGLLSLSSTRVVVDPHNR